MLAPPLVLWSHPVFLVTVPRALDDRTSLSPKDMMQRKSTASASVGYFSLDFGDTEVRDAAVQMSGVTAFSASEDVATQTRRLVPTSSCSASQTLMAK